MPTTFIEETASVTIAAPPDLVRQQFSDIEHHAQTHPHAGVRFEVLEANGQRTRYRQISRVGPLRVSQTLTCEHTTTGPLVNTVTAGPFSGGTITFDIKPDGVDTTKVVATLATSASGIDALIGRFSRRKLQRTLAAALDEDRIDIETGNYPSSRS